MAERLSLWLWNLPRSEFNAINANADELDVVEMDVVALKRLIKQQADDILWLRATVMGVVEVLHAKAPFDDAELANAVRAAHMQLTAPPTPPTAPTAGDPYRGGAAGAPAGPPVVLRTYIRCKRQVPASRITVFPDGEVCDSCL